MKKLIATKTIGGLKAGRIFETFTDTADALIRMGRAREWTPEMDIKPNLAETRETKVIEPEETKEQPKKRGRKPKA